MVALKPVESHIIDGIQKALGRGSNPCPGTTFHFQQQILGKRAAAKVGKNEARKGTRDRGISRLLS